MVHEDAQRPRRVAVDRAEAGGGLADRPVDAVLQELLRPVGPHRGQCRDAQVDATTRTTYVSETSSTRAVIRQHPSSEKYTGVIHP